MPLRSRIPGRAVRAGASGRSSRPRSRRPRSAAPVARAPSSRTRSTSVSPRMVRFVRDRDRVEIRERGVPPHCPHRIDGVQDRVRRAAPRRTRGATASARSCSSCRVRSCFARAVEVRLGACRSSSRGPTRRSRPARPRARRMRCGPSSRRGCVRGAASDPRARSPTRARRRASAHRGCPPASAPRRTARSRDPPRRGKRCGPVSSLSRAGEDAAQPCRRRARARRSASSRIQYPGVVDALDVFSPATRAWFEQAFDAPTPAQALGWPAIASGEHTLIQAPTGSGKTLAAFLYGIDRLTEEGAGTRPAAPLRLAAQGAQLRHRAQPARPARRARTPTCASPCAPATRRSASARRCCASTRTS